MYRWAEGDAKLANSNLPADKQYLITKGVPSLKRLAELQKFEFDHQDELEKDAGDGWVETFNIVDNEKKTALEFEDEDEEKKEKPVTEKKAVIDLADSDDEDDDNMFVEAKAPAKKEPEKLTGMTKKVRKYDLSITYDFYT